MTELFGRQVNLAIDDLAYRDLRVDFKIEKTISGEPNSAKITVWNLNRDRTEMVVSRKRDTLIRLEAGYNVPRLLFQGNPTKGGITVKNDGPDRKLEIEAQDGLNEYQNARIFKSFRAGTKIKKVVDEAVSAFDLPAGEIEVPSDRELTQGVTFNGRAADILDRVATSTAADWSIQDGKIRFIPSGETSGNQAVVFSSKNGNLVGSPEPKDDGLKITGLLDGSVNPGDRFVVESEEYDGIYKAKNVTYKGSRWKRQFYIIIVGSET